MGKILIPGGGGGGVSSDDVTVKQSDVPVGLTTVTSDSDDEIVEGTLTTTATSDKVLKDETFYNTETHQKESGTIESMEAQTIIPGSSEQIVSCTGKYMTGDVTINAVSGLTAGNIAYGVTVGGVNGTYKGLGSATQNQVLNGCTFSTETLSNASGTMTNYSGYTSTSNYVSSTFRSGTTGYVFASPGGTGYYTTGSYLRIPATNLSPSNIKKDVNIMGITGTWEGYVSDTLYFFNNGTWSNLSTTGITYIGTKQMINGGGYLSSSNVYVSGSNMVITGTSDGSDNNFVYVAGRLNQTVNLTNYNYLKFKYNSNSVGTNTPIYNAYVYISTDSKTVNGYLDGADMSNTGIGILDISSITGNYYIYIGATFEINYRKPGSASYVYLTQLFLSKS